MYSTFSCFNSINNTSTIDSIIGAQTVGIHYEVDIAYPCP